MPEDRENASEQLHFATINDRALRRQEADQGLRHGQPNGLHLEIPPFRQRPVFFDFGRSDGESQNYKTSTPKGKRQL